MSKKEDKHALAVWLKQVYEQPSVTESFFKKDTEEPNRFKSIREREPSVRALSAKFDLEKKKEFNENTSKGMIGFTHRVVDEIFRLSGHNDKEKAKILAYTQALADITGFRKRDEDITPLERFNTQNVLSMLSSPRGPAQHDPSTKALIQNLKDLLNKKPQQPML
ncbi:hypothetical protein PCANC_08196 [Puccinia coronata f. sp. avenae]|uniref:Uncharacterized protein n=2 Tax=Puccinia coronata f. sp. avenae TaxID=200324 RepID=A0A2N5VKP4_9BASI|nr:hypothetical protein PCANC_08196 [Puccinia coronata f. sp. avenae]PLW50564.1 hypothetical protein PCASD_01490 [Puccinia coronata f. sp. avenae]